MEAYPKCLKNGHIYIPGFQKKEHTFKIDEKLEGVFCCVF